MKIFEVSLVVEIKSDDAEKEIYEWIKKIKEIKVSQESKVYLNKILN